MCRIGIRTINSGEGIAMIFDQLHQICPALDGDIVNTKAIRYGDENEPSGRDG